MNRLIFTGEHGNRQRIQVVRRTEQGEDCLYVYVHNNHDERNLIETIAGCEFQELTFRAGTRVSKRMMEYAHSRCRKPIQDISRG